MSLIQVHDRRCCLYIDTVDKTVYFLFNYFTKGTDMRYANRKKTVKGIDIPLHFIFLRKDFRFI